MRRVLDDAVSVKQIERVVRKWQPLSVGLPKVAAKPLLLEVRSRQRDRRRREVHAGNDRATLGESRKIGSRTTSDFQDLPAGIAVEIDEPEQMVELFKMVLIEIGEEPWRPDRMRRDLEIVYVLIPILPNIVCGCGRRRRHGAYYKIKAHMRTVASFQLPVSSSIS